jgi:hypothetical protein
MSTYTFAGTSRRFGKVKVRFANSAERIKVLMKTDHTEIDLIELPRAMDKAEIALYLKEIDFVGSRTGEQRDEVIAAIEEAIVKYNPDMAPPKEPKAKKEKAPAAVVAEVKTDPSEEWKKVLMGIRIQVNEMINRGELDESEFDNKVDELIAAEEAREEAEIRASIEADLEAARAANTPALIEETAAKGVPVDETVAEEQDEEAPY